MTSKKRRNENNNDSSSEDNEVEIEISVAARTNIRKGYRKLGADINDHGEELKAPDPAFLSNKVTELDILFQQVKNNKTAAPEATLDANVIHSIASLTRKNVNLIQATFQTFNPNEYGEKLVIFMNAGHPTEPGCVVSEAGWDKLAKCFLPHVRRAPIFRPLYGTFEVKEAEKPKKNARKPRQQAENVKATQPENVKGAEKSENELTEEEVQRVYTVIKKIVEKNPGKSISYFELILHPSNFPQTIENIFHLSFLAKDNLIKIIMDEDGLPVVVLLGVGSKNKGDTADQTKNQFVMQITMDDWEEMVKIWDIRKPMIRPRARV